MSEASKTADQVKDPAKDFTDTAPAKPKAKPAAEAHKIAKPLSEGRLKIVIASAADVGNVHAAVTPIGTPYEDVLEPEFWAQVAYKLRVGDEIIVHTDDMTYYARLLVRDVGGPSLQRVPNRAIVAELMHQQLGPLAKELRNKTHEAKFMGPHLKWCVIALSDQQVLKDGFSTAEEAQGWMRSRAA